MNMNDNLVLFNAPDYQLYAFSKNSGQQKWSYNLNRKSDFPAFFSGNYIWTTNGAKQVIKLDPVTGNLVNTLTVATIETKPFLKNDILYFTGLYDGGCLIAYDINADSVLWKRFLAHGVSTTPYYLDDKIVANAEGDNWIEVNYDGTLKEAGCDKDAVEGDFPSQLPCVKQFIALTHDGMEIKGKLAEDLALNADNIPAITSTAKNSFILNDGRLIILGNKLKKKSSLLLASLSDELEETSNAPAKILRADEEKITMLYSNHFIIYHHRDKKLLKLVDLSQWEPHQAILDEDKLWLISRKDGLLYGLVIN
jgi:outer membrane protein assembly factor BamB